MLIPSPLLRAAKPKAAKPASPLRAVHRQSAEVAALQRTAEPERPYPFVRIPLFRKPIPLFQKPPNLIDNPDPYSDSPYPYSDQPIPLFRNPLPLT